MSNVLLVLTNLPDATSAKQLASELVQRQLAACVNQLAPCTSTYQWEGKLCQEQEIPMLIKTTQQAYPAVEACIKELHPYELPEVIAIPITSGLAGYLSWVTQSVAH